MEKVILGTTIKLNVNLVGTPDVSIESMEYVVKVWAAPKNDSEQPVPSDDKIVVIPKELAIAVDKYNAIVEVPTALIGRGYVIVRVEAQVPDTDCASGYRKEIEQRVANIDII